ncbi:MAG: thiazole synthase [Candidatus Omnitrophota bacterium]
MEEILEIAGKQIRSRLFVGTGKFASYPVMKSALEASGAEVVTVALRRVDGASKTENILEYIPRGAIVMTNTSGARNADEAVRIARLAKAGGAGNWIKIEVIQDNKYLLPDNLETLRATEILVKEGFVVLPYMSPDLSMARRLVDAGAAAVMPLGSPIGSNRGVKTRELVEIMIREIPMPVIVDAGLGKPSEACECMEIGCAAVLVNTAIAIAEDPAAMAKAFNKAVKAGRLAYCAGLPPTSAGANASSPLTGFLREVTEGAE